MTDLDILGSNDTAALTIVGSTYSDARRLMQKVIILLIGPTPDGYDLLAKIRNNAPSQDQVNQYLQLGRETVLGSLAFTDRMLVKSLELAVNTYTPPAVSIDINLATANENVQTTVGT